MSSALEVFSSLCSASEHAQNNDNHGLEQGLNAENVFFNLLNH